MGERCSSSLCISISSSSGSSSPFPGRVTVWVARSRYKVDINVIRRASYKWTQVGARFISPHQFIGGHEKGVLVCRVYDSLSCE